MTKGLIIVTAMMTAGLNVSLAETSVGGQQTADDILVADTVAPADTVVNEMAQMRDSLMTVIEQQRAEIVRLEQRVARLDSDKSAVAQYTIAGLETALAREALQFDRFDKEAVNRIVTASDIVGHDSAGIARIVEQAEALTEAAGGYASALECIESERWQPGMVDSLKTKIDELRPQLAMFESVSNRLDSVTIKLGELKLAMLYIEPIVSEVVNDATIKDLVTSSRPNRQMVIEEIDNLVGRRPDLKAKLAVIETYSATRQRYDSLIRMVIDGKLKEVDENLQELIETL